MKKKCWRIINQQNINIQEKEKNT